MTYWKRRAPLVLATLPAGSPPLARLIFTGAITPPPQHAGMVFSLDHTTSCLEPVWSLSGACLVLADARAPFVPPLRQCDYRAERSSERRTQHCSLFCLCSNNIGATQ